MKPSFLFFYLYLHLVPVTIPEGEKKLEVTNNAPRIVFDDAMKQKQLIHNISTDILGNGVRYPFVRVLYSFDNRILPKILLTSIILSRYSIKRLELVSLRELVKFVICAIAMIVYCLIWYAFDLFVIYRRTRTMQRVIFPLYSYF